MEPFRSIEALSKSRLSIKPFSFESMDDAMEVKLIDELETPQVEPPPDGGWLAWTQVLMGHLLVINGFGYISSFGFFQAYYATTLNRPASDISWVGSVQMFLLFLIGTFSGRAMDAGFFRSLIVAGCSMQLVGVFATSFSTKYWQLFLAQGITQGIGNGLLFTPTVALVSTYFDKNRTIALGVCACGAPVGGVIFPIVCIDFVPIHIENCVLLPLHCANGYIN
jgi:MFS family permease